MKIPQSINDLFEIFDQFKYNDPESNASSIDKYLRALCKCMIDHSDKEISYELIAKIFAEAEYYDLIEYNSDWENLKPVDIDKYPEKESTFETAIITIKGLIGELRNKEKDYQNQYAKLKDQLDKSGLKHIPFYGYQGHFADWKNSHLADIISCLESYIFGSQDRKKVQIGLNDAGPGWNFIPEWLIIGIMYE